MTTLFGKPVFFVACEQVPDKPEPEQTKYEYHILVTLIGDEADVFSIHAPKRKTLASDIDSYRKLRDWMAERAQKYDRIAWTLNSLSARLERTPFSSFGADIGFDHFYMGAAPFLGMPVPLWVDGINSQTLDLAKKRFVEKATFVRKFLEAFNAKGADENKRRELMQMAESLLK